ncbi:MAG: DUF4177 domain-containing protein [Oscillospiraceae bacterium]|nr:DUF4177 domain-containing protein [Oscillospiraceae bacterium]
MKKFEYKVLSQRRGVFTSGEKYAEQFATELNKHGTEGWDLVEVTGNVFIDGYAILVFKREIDIIQQ